MSYLSFLKFVLISSTFLAITTITDRFITSEYQTTTVDFLKVVKSRGKGNSTTQHVNLVLNNATVFPVSIHGSWHYDNGDSVITQRTPWFNNPITITNIHKQVVDKAVSGPHIYFFCSSYSSTYCCCDCYFIWQQNKYTLHLCSVFTSNIYLFNYYDYF